MLGSDGPVAIGNAKEDVTRFTWGVESARFCLIQYLQIPPLWLAISNIRAFQSSMMKRQITGKANRILQSNLTVDPPTETYAQTNLICSFYCQCGCNGWQCREQVYDQQNITTVTNNWQVSECDLRVSGRDRKRVRQSERESRVSEGTQMSNSN